MLNPILKIDGNLFLDSANNISRDARPPASVTAGGVDIVLNPNSNILIAEDNKVNADLMKAMIESMGINKIAIANDGKEAINMILSDIKFNLIIIDIMMPRINGLDLLKEIRKLYNKMPILVVSALGDNETKNKALALGANYYLTKPIDKDIFKQKINSLFKVITENN